MLVESIDAIFEQWEDYYNTNFGINYRKSWKSIPNFGMNHFPTVWPSDSRSLPFAINAVQLTIGWIIGKSVVLSIGLSKSLLRSLNIRSLGHLAQSRSNPVSCRYSLQNSSNKRLPIVRGVVFVVIQSSWFSSRRRFWVYFLMDGHKLLLMLERTVLKRDKLNISNSSWLISTRPLPVISVVLDRCLATGGL